jgi:glycosyltransferase EpsE
LKISVIIPLFNGNISHVEKALFSVLNQAYVAEILVINESTQTDINNMIASLCLKYPIIRNVTTGSKIGLSKSLNLGLSLTSCDLVARMDADDMSLPDRFEKQRNYLMMHPDVAIVGSAIELIDDTGAILGNRYFPKIVLPNSLHTNLFSAINHPSVMLKKSKLKNINQLYNNNLQYAEDLQLWLRLLDEGVCIHNLQDTLLQFRISKKDRSIKHWSAVVKIRFEAFCRRASIIRLIALVIAFIVMLIPSKIKLFLRHLLGKL